MPNIADIFGSEKLSYEEFVKKAAESGGEFGDVAAIRKAHAEEIKRLQIGHEIERESVRAGAKNSGLLMRVLDMSAVTVDNAGVHGIAEQIGKLRESDPYLFTDSASSSPILVNTGAPHAHAPLDPDSLSDEEFYKGKYKR